MDAYSELKRLLESRRLELGWSREMVARQTKRYGTELSAADVRYLETSCRQPPHPERLRAVAQVLGLSYSQVTAAVTLGLREW